MEQKLSIEQLALMPTTRDHIPQPDYTLMQAIYFGQGVEGVPNEAESVCIEECSELQKELTKLIRGKGRREKLIEELTDVWITLQNIRWKHNITADMMQYVIDDKLYRRWPELYARVYEDRQTLPPEKPEPQQLENGDFVWPKSGDPSVFDRIEEDLKWVSNQHKHDPSIQKLAEDMRELTEIVRDMAKFESQMKDWACRHLQLRHG